MTISVIASIFLITLGGSQILLWIFFLRQRAPSGRAATDSPMQVAAAVEPAVDWMTDMRQVANEASQMLDERIARAAVTLERLDTHAAPDSRAVSSSSLLPTGTTRRSRKTTKGDNTQIAEQPSTNAPASAFTAVAVDRTLAADLKGSRERVLALAAEGIARADIARATGMNLAEVELCLTLAGSGAGLDRERQPAKAG